MSYPAIPETDLCKQIGCPASCTARRLTASEPFLLLRLAERPDQHAHSPHSRSTDVAVPDQTPAGPEGISRSRTWRSPWPTLRSHVASSSTSLRPSVLHPGSNGTTAYRRPTQVCRASTVNATASRTAAHRRREAIFIHRGKTLWTAQPLPAS